MQPRRQCLRLRRSNHQHPKLPVIMTLIPKHCQHRRRPKRHLRNRRKKRGNLLAVPRKNNPLQQLQYHSNRIIIIRHINKSNCIILILNHKDRINNKYNNISYLNIQLGDKNVLHPQQALLEEQVCHHQQLLGFRRQLLHSNKVFLQLRQHQPGIKIVHGADLVRHVKICRRHQPRLLPKIKHRCQYRYGQRHQRRDRGPPRFRQLKSHIILLTLWLLELHRNPQQNHQRNGPMQQQQTRQHRYHLHHLRTGDLIRFCLQRNRRER